MWEQGCAMIREIHRALSLGMGHHKNHGLQRMIAGFCRFRMGHMRWASVMKTLWQFDNMWHFRISRRLRDRRPGTVFFHLSQETRWQIPGDQQWWYWKWRLEGNLQSCREWRDWGLCLWSLLQADHCDFVYKVMPASWACFWITTGTWEGCGQEGSWRCWMCSCDRVDPGLVSTRNSERRWTRSKRNDARFGQMAFRFFLQVKRHVYLVLVTFACCQVKLRAASKSIPKSIHNQMTKWLVMNLFALISASHIS